MIIKKANTKFGREIDTFKTRYDISVTVDDTLSPIINFTLKKDNNIVYSYKVNSVDIVDYDWRSSGAVSQMFYDMRAKDREQQLKDIGI